ENLDHGEHFGPAGEERRIGRPEGRALSESDEQVIDEAGTPTRALELGPLIVWDLHLWEKKAGAAEFFSLVSQGGTAAIQPPIPEREHDHIGEPEQPAGKQ